MTAAASSSWTQTMGVLVGTAVVATNLSVTPPGNILEAAFAQPIRHSSSLYASAATRSFNVDYGIVNITRVTVQSRSRWYRYVARRLAELASGEHVSDMPVTYAALCDRALNVAEELFNFDTPTPSVVPSEDGTVLFVWRSQPLELEIEVRPEETSVWAYERSRGRIWSGQLEEQQARFSNLLGSFGSPQRSGPAAISSR